MNTTTQPKKTVLITGSSRGIGKAIALELAELGYEVVIHGRSASERLTATYKQIEKSGGSVRQLTFDVGDREMAKKCLEDDIAKNGMYYGVVLNAGITRDNAFPFIAAKDWDDVITTNLSGFYNVLKPLVEPFITTRRGGRIVVISSVSGIRGNRGQVNYSAAKAGLIGAAKALGIELAKKRVTVNCIAPGLIETDLTTAVAKERVIPYIPMRRIGRPDEVSGLVGFLMSERSSYITRQVIAIDGGIT